MATPQPAERFTDRLRRLLAALYRGPRGTEQGAFVHAVFGRGSAAEASAAHRGLTPRLLRELASSEPDDVNFVPATMTTDGKRAFDLGFVFTEIALDPKFDGHAFRVPDADLEAVTRRLAAFPLGLGALIDAGDGLFVAWFLREPAALDDPATLARVEAVQQALAATLGGRTDMVQAAIPRNTIGATTRTRTLPAWSPLRACLPCPGSRNHGLVPEGRVVVLVHLDAAMRYDLFELEAALGITKANGRKAGRK